MTRAGGPATDASAHDPPGLAWVDGRTLPIREATIPVTDRGFLLGDGVFETLRTLGEHIIGWEGHRERLLASMERTQIPLTDGVETALAAARPCVDACRRRWPDVAEWLLRVTVTRGDSGHGLGRPAVVEPRVVLLVRPFEPPTDTWYVAGISAITARTRRSPPMVQDPRIKATSALHLVLAKLEAEAAGADEGLLLDMAGNYLEATSANLFVLCDDVWWTPAGPHGVLEGLTAERALQVIADMGRPVRREPVPPEVMHAADECFLTQTSRGIVPLTRLDGRSFGAGREGPMTARIRHAYEAALRAEYPADAPHADGP